MWIEADGGSAPGQIARPRRVPKSSLRIADMTDRDLEGFADAWPDVTSIASRAEIARAFIAAVPGTP